MARGTPSRIRTSWAIASRSSASGSKPGTAARARSHSRATASLSRTGSPRPGTGRPASATTASPTSPITRRLVSTNRVRSVRSSHAATTSALSSTTIVSPRAASARPTCSARSPSPPPTPIAPATAPTTPAPSDAVVRSQNQAPAYRSTRGSSSSWPTSRVLPTSPIPSTVASRLPSIAAHSASSSRCRPTNRVRGAAGVGVGEASVSASRHDGTFSTQLLPPVPPRREVPLRGGASSIGGGVKLGCTLIAAVAGASAASAQAPAGATMIRPAFGHLGRTPTVRIGALVDAARGHRTPDGTSDRLGAVGGGSIDLGRSLHAILERLRSLRDDRVWWEIAMAEQLHTTLSDQRTPPPSPPAPLPPPAPPPSRPSPQDPHRSLITPHPHPQKNHPRPPLPQTGVVRRSVRGVWAVGIGDRDGEWELSAGPSSDHGAFSGADARSPSERRGRRPIMGLTAGPTHDDRGTTGRRTKTMRSGGDRRGRSAVVPMNRAPAPLSDP